MMFDSASMEDGKGWFVVCAVTGVPTKLARTAIHAVRLLIGFLPIAGFDLRPPDLRSGVRGEPIERID
jgi:hypothetical protein